MARYPALDGLRGLAALIVVMFHSGPLSGGFLGVDMFFVLSGFLITSILAVEIERTGKVDFGRFYLARATRLLPALAVFLALQIVLLPYIWPSANPIGNAVRAGLFLTDVSMPLWSEPPPVGIGHTWSLSIEFHFYLIWPIVLILLLRGTSWRTQTASLVVLYVLATAWRLIRMYHTDYTGAYFAFDTRLSGLVLGALMAVVATRYTDSRQMQSFGPWFMAILAAVVIITQSSRMALGVPMVLMELATAGLILGLLNGSGYVYRLFSSRILTYTGMISYALYLWHPLVALAMPRGTPWYWKLPIVLALSYAIATASWYLIEARALGLRRLRAAAPAPQTS